MGREFGKKTGKALGNKLFGKHADDIRVSKRVSWTNENGIGNGSSAVDYEAIEKAKRKSMEYEQQLQLQSREREQELQLKSREHEQELNLVNTVIGIQFDMHDRDSLIKDLTFLVSTIDLWLQNNNKKNLPAAKAQFEAGLVMLQTLDSENTMCAYFTHKQSEWEEFVAKKRKRQLMQSAVIAGAIITILVVGLVMS